MVLGHGISWLHENKLGPRALPWKIISLSLWWQEFGFVVFDFFLCVHTCDRELPCVFFFLWHNGACWTRCFVHLDHAPCASRKIGFSWVAVPYSWAPNYWSASIWVCPDFLLYSQRHNSDSRHLLVFVIFNYFQHILHVICFPSLTKFFSIPLPQNIQVYLFSRLLINFPPWLDFGHVTMHCWKHNRFLQRLWHLLLDSLLEMSSHKNSWNPVTSPTMLCVLSVSVPLDFWFTEPRGTTFTDFWIQNCQEPSQSRWPPRSPLIRPFGIPSLDLCSLGTSTCAKESLSKTTQISSRRISRQLLWAVGLCGCLL